MAGEFSQSSLILFLSKLFTGNKDDVELVIYPFLLWAYRKLSVRSKIFTGL
jgi:hypothetical protein